MMQSAPMSTGNGWSSAAQPSPKFFHPSQLRKLRDSEQVAAICYRIGRGGIEFLLVQTRGGRWTFPKGGVEPGLSHAQAAALEAYEEAGVHGRMEETAFTRYWRRTDRPAIHAHLCEVLRLERPPESNRNPTWFSDARAKRRLREDRTRILGDELARVVDSAVARIHRLGTARPLPPPQPDGLQRVQFEAAESYPDRMQFARYRRVIRSVAAVEVAMKGYVDRTLETSPARQLAETSEVARVVEISGGRPAHTKEGASARRSKP